jgi:hypothetical protein
MSSGSTLKADLTQRGRHFAFGPIPLKRAMTIFEQFGRRDHCVRVQARKGVREHVYGMISQGEADERAASPMTACRQACSDCPSTMPRQISVSS